MENKFEVGDICEAFGCRGVVTKNFKDEGFSIVVKFDIVDYTTSFLSDGKGQYWHKEPSLKLISKVGKSMMKLPENDFEEISFSELQRVSVSKKPDRAWKNNHYVVQLYYDDRVVNGIMMDKWMIRRNDSQTINGFYELQNIKNKLIGEDVEAYQVFPKKNDLVDVANLYWLFTPTAY